MDVFLIILCIVVAGLLFLVNLYLMAIYSHSDDKNTCTVIFCKIVIVLTLLQCQLQQLMLTLDASNSRSFGSGLNLTIMWEIFFMSVWSNLGFLLPLAVFLYESDDEKSVLERVATTICEVIITIGVVCVLTFVSYIYLKGASMPIELIVVAQGPQITQAVSQQTIDTNIAIPYYVMGLMCFFGYIVLVFCGGCGLTALPLDLIMQFRMRPRWRRTSQANAKKQQLRQVVLDLMKTGQHLKKKMKEADYETSWWQRRKNKAILQKDMNEWQELYNNHCDHYELFKMELKMADTNPLVFIGKLILGIISIFITFLWWFQILFSELIRVDGKPLTFLIDSLMLYFEENNASFAGIILFMIMTQYLVMCILKGSFKFGLSIPYLFSFHPMAEGKTWMNSFLFNLAISVLGSTAICHLCASCFPEYLRGTEIQAILIHQVNYLKFFQAFFKNKVFVYMFLIWSVLVSVFVIIKGVQKPELLKKIDEKRKKLKMQSVEIEMQELQNQPKKETKSKVTVVKRSK